MKALCRRHHSLPADDFITCRNMFTQLLKAVEPALKNSILHAVRGINKRPCMNVRIINKSCPAYGNTQEKKVRRKQQLGLGGLKNGVW